jgi:TRAP-type uncharacterized transport system substrate-binding protein
VKPQAQRTQQRRVIFDTDAWNNTELAWIAGFGSLFLAGALWLFLGWYAPPPKSTLVIASGPASGAYYHYALKYRELLEKHGIHAQVIESKGTVENLERLSTGRAACCADVAFVQSGPWNNTQDDELQSLAVVSLELVWVFVDPLRFMPKQLIELSGRRVALGMLGSGTLPVAQAVLEKAGVAETDVDRRYMGGLAALEALRTGEIQAAFLVASASAPIVHKALDMGLRPMPIGNAQAFERHLPWSQMVTLPRGVMSVAQNIPGADLPMLAVNTNLVVREKLHESLKFLLLDIATSVHADQGLVHGNHRFPTPEGLLFAQGDASRDFFKSGRPWLYKYLPFWSAHQINRLLLSLLPVLVVILPLLRAAIAFNERRNKATIMRLLAQIKEVHLKFDDGVELTEDDQRVIRFIRHELGRFKPLTIHSVDYFRIHETMHALNKSTKEAGITLEASRLSIVRPANRIGGANNSASA